MISGRVARAYLWLCECIYYPLARYYDAISWLVSAGQWRRWQRGVWDVIGTGSEKAKVLEIGCGTAAMMVEGAVRGQQMVGVDLSPSMLTVAAARLEIARSDAQLVRAEGQRIPFESGSFEAVFATFPAGYILAHTTLTEVHRVLQGRGRFVLLGLWVELHVGELARVIPVFYSRPSDSTRRRIAGAVEAAGFTTQWVEQRHGWATVGVLVAERKP